MKTGGYAAAFAVMALMFGDVAAAAQQAAPRYVDDGFAGGTPFGKLADPGDPAAVKMPALAFRDDGTAAADFDKYYAFRRADTDFATAYADIAECDGYARGLQSGIGYVQTPYQYAGTMAGALGGAIGNVMAAMIFGSAEKRRLRRVNMRTCMNFKGYDRYGLSKDVWDEFNFEEGLSGVTEGKRQVYLKQQALVASSGNLPGKALGL